jgi:hypothetical protein
VLGVVHRLREGGAHGREMRIGTAVVGGFPPTLGEQPGSGDVGVDQCDEGCAKGGEFVGKHSVLAGQGVDEHSGKGSPLGRRMAFALGKGR